MHYYVDCIMYLYLLAGAIAISIAPAMSCIVYLHILLVATSCIVYLHILQVVDTTEANTNILRCYVLVCHDRIFQAALRYIPQSCPLKVQNEPLLSHELYHKKIASTGTLIVKCALVLHFHMNFWHP